MSDPRSIAQVVTAASGLSGAGVTMDVSNAGAFAVGQLVELYPQQYGDGAPLARAGQTVRYLISAIAGAQLTGEINTDAYANPPQVEVGWIIDGRSAAGAGGGFITILTAAELEASWESNSHFYIPPGLGDLALLDDLDATGMENIYLEISDGSALVVPGGHAGVLAGTPGGPTLSAGTTFNATLTEFSGAGTLSGGAGEGLARGDIACIVRGTATWQLLRVKAVSGLIHSFYTGFCAPFDANWKLCKLTPSCENIRIKGLIKRGAGAAAAVGVSITGGVNIDLSGLKTEDFNLNADDAGVYLHTCYDVQFSNLRDQNSGAANTAAVIMTSCTKVAAFAPMIQATNIFPLTFVACTDLDLFAPHSGAGGRPYKFDVCHDVRLFAPSGMNTGPGGGSGISIQNSALFGTGLAGARYNIFQPNIHFNGGAGLISDGGGIRDIHVWGGSLAYNNRDLTAANVVVGNGDEMWLHDVDTEDSVQVGAGASLWLDNLEPQTMSPLVVQGGPALAVTPTLAEYERRGKRIDFTAVLTVTSGVGAVAGQPIVITLPVAAATIYSTTFPIIGAGYLYVAAGGTVYPGVVQLNSANSYVLVPTNLSGGAIAFTGAVDYAGALAAGDVIKIQGQYRAA